MTPNAAWRHALRRVLADLGWLIVAMFLGYTFGQIVYAFTHNAVAASFVAGAMTVLIGALLMLKPRKDS